MQTNGEVKKGFWQEGVPFIWLSGMAMLVLIGMIAGMVALVFAKGFTHFWPADAVRIVMKDGSVMQGQVMATEAIPEFHDAGAVERRRTLVKIANRDVYGLDFKWVDDVDIAVRTHPPDAVVIERVEYGAMTGTVAGLKTPDGLRLSSAPGFWELLAERLERTHELLDEIGVREQRLMKVRAPLTETEIAIRKLRYGEKRDFPETVVELERLQKEQEAILARIGPSIARLDDELKGLHGEASSVEVIVVLATGEEKVVPLKKVVRLYRPNRMSVWDKSAQYLSRLAEFLLTSPRESNTEGGIFPALFGTVLMVLIMAVTTTPLGVLTALYLSEYAKPGILLNLARLAINNLAGVPSIVFGIFGLGFFIYFIGGGIDRLFFSASLPTPTFGTGGILWASLTLALLTVPVVVVATEEGLSAVPRANREASLALGASKFQTIWNVVLPNAMPGILTGVILAVSRGAGEVAPLMITGVVKLTSSLPVDGGFPFFHLDRKFMHLGFHIYDVGFQSPNVEAAKPMVYTTTLLLLVMVVALNLLAMVLRNRLRKKYKGSAL